MSVFHRFIGLTNGGYVSTYCRPFFKTFSDARKKLFYISCYIQGGYNVEMEGTKNQCFKWIEEFWMENNIHEDQRIFLTSK